MRITYLYHSGFAIEGDGFTLIADYYQAPGEQVMEQLLERSGKLYVLASHHHPDHYNPEILCWRNKRPDIHFIFSRDILAKRLAQPDDAYFLRKGDIFDDETLRIEAFGSTDVGVSFVVATQKEILFHAGDLNNWHWKEESTDVEIAKADQEFLEVVKSIKRSYPHIHLCFFPVDPRMGNDFDKGARQFVDNIKCDIFVPMHMWERYEEANAFERYAKEKGIFYLRINHPGDSFTL